MGQSMTLTRYDLSALLRVVGSRKGADIDAILKFEQSHHRKPPTAEQVGQSISRLLAAGLVTQQGNHYLSAPHIQAAFFNEVRNCRDTVEEFDVLNRVLAQTVPQLIESS
jgi:hypothetical protein